MTKVRVHQDNINTETYFDKEYSNPDYWMGWAPVLERMQLEMSLIKKKYKVHLDVGCADGEWTRLMLKDNPDSVGYGIDISEIVCKVAVENCPQGIFNQADCYYLPFSDGFFDLVHAAEIIEHLEEPERAIAEIYRVLKPGGDLILTTPFEQNGNFDPDYIEHLWRWDIEGIREYLGTRMDKSKLVGFKIVEEHSRFYNGHLFYVRAEKI